MNQELLEYILKVSRFMAETRTLTPLLDYVVDEAIQLVGAERGYIVLPRPDGSLDFKVQHGKNGQILHNAEDQISHTLLQRVIDSGEPLVLRDAFHDPFFKDVESVIILELRSIMCVPLIAQGSTIGAIYVENRAIRGRFSQDDVIPLIVFANQAAVAIENARLFQHLQAAHDELEQRVAERTAELAHANAQLKQEIAERESAKLALKKYAEHLEDIVRERTSELQTHYAQLDAILNSVGDAILMTDRDMRIVYANPSFTTLTGYEREEVLGVSVCKIGIAVEDPQAQAYLLPHSLIQGQIWTGETIIKRKDGRTYDAALTIAPVYDEAEGTMLGYVASHQDISQSKALENARKQFISSVSHQFRTPVTTLQLYAHLLSQADLPERSQIHLQMMKEELAQLVELIKDILRINRLDSDKAVTVWEPISIPNVLNTLTTRYQDRIKEATLTLSIAKLPVKLPTVKGDQSQLTQAIGEVLENAINFTPAEGQITVKINMVKVENRPWLTIAVRDSGPGMLPEEQEHAFDRFYRGSQAESKEIPGTGLGLCIAQAIVQAH
ncbi:MAG: PAS domain S-box protein, partial [Anaerolineae bacterium]|nr:PAS domain S-box protein [Anaerolineae bacterium]